MRNPIIVKETFRHLDDLSSTSNGTEDSSVLVSGIALNHQTEKAYLLFSDGSLKFYDNSNDLLTCYQTLQLEFEGLQETWIKIDYVAAIGTIVCISLEGSISTVSETNPDEAPEQIGMIDNGISSAAWSPDYSCLLLVTNNDTLLCMSVNWDVLYEVPNPSRLPGSVTTISWKGDGDMVSVLSTDQDDQITRIRLYNKQLELVSVARNVTEGGGNMGGGGAGGVKGIGKGMVFSPNGVLVAFDMKKPSGSHQIAFIEKNGLRHGEFDLLWPRGGGGEGWAVSSLQYDPTSTFLLVHWYHAHATEGCVQIYYRHNYYWYLGQEVVESQLQPLAFDPEHPLVLYLTHFLGPSDQDGKGGLVLRTLELGWAGYECKGGDNTMCVVQGSQLHLTPLRSSIIPPPMYKHLLALPLPARHMSLVPLVDGGWVGGVLLSDRGVVSLIQGPEGASPELTAWGDLGSLDGAEELNSELKGVALGGHRFRSLTLSLTAQSIILHLIASCCPSGSNLKQDEEEGGELLLCVELDRTMFFEHKKLVIQSYGKLTQIPGVVYHFQFGGADDEEGQGVMGLQSSETLNFEVYSLPKSWRGTWCFPLSPPTLLLTLPEICPSSLVVDVEEPSLGGSRKERLVVSLSSRQHLYLQDVLVHTHVTSWAYSPQTSLLYFTTPTPPLLHYLYLPALSALLTQEGGGGEGGGEGVYPLIHRYLSDPRPIERGGRLVSLVDTRILLLLPRGNLEVFEPRSLVLLTLYSLIVTKRDLVSAFLLCRRQKLSFQVFIEVCPEIFLQEINAFVSALLKIKQGAEYLCQFIMNIGEGKGGGGGYSPGLFLLVKDVHEDLLLRNVSFMKRIAQEEGEEASLGGGGLVSLICKETRRHLLDHLHTMFAEGSNKVTRGAATPLALLQAILCTFAQQGGKEGVHQAVDFMLLVAGGQGAGSGARGGVGLRDYIRGGIDNSFFQLPPSPVAITSPLAVSYQRLASLLASPPQPISLPLAPLPVLLKYLTHLLTPTTLYPLLLGRGEIGMCKVLLSTLQLDPRTYLPPLRRYEEMMEGVGGEKGGLLTHIYVLTLMQMEGVEVGEGEGEGMDGAKKNREGDVLVHYLALLKQLFLEEEQGQASTKTESLPPILTFLRTSMEGVVKAGVEQGKGEQLVKFIEGVESRVLGRGHGTTARAILEEFRNAFFLAMARHLKQKGQGGEAVSFFLSTTPPSVSLALDTLLEGGAYYQAYSVAQLYDSDLGVKGVALRIVEQYRSHLRRCLQLSSDFQVSLPDPPMTLSTVSTPPSTAPVFPLPLPSFPTLHTPSSQALPSPALADFIAQLCVEWGGVGAGVGDVEGGVEILLQSKKYSSALKLAKRWGRGGDLGDEVVGVARGVGAEMVEYVKGLRVAYLERVGFLKTIWSAAEKLEAEGEAAGDRLQTLTLLDPDLQYFINNSIDMPGVGGPLPGGMGAGGEGEGGGDWGETASEFSSLSLYSSSSRTSSVVSSSSYLSNVSDARSLGGGSVNGGGGGGAFVIRGLDHALLSRGGVEDCNPRGMKGGGSGASKVGAIGLDGEAGEGVSHVGEGGASVDKRTRNRQKRDQTARRQKRIERSKAKGHVQDSFQLEKEEASCEELTRISLSLPDVIALVLDLSQTLLSTGLLADRLLVREMGHEMQALCKAVQSSEPPSAPKYPLAYLRLRQMASVISFQAHRFEKTAEKTVEGESWFQLTARAIEHWFKSRLLLFSS